MTMYTEGIKHIIELNSPIYDSHNELYEMTYAGRIESESLYLIIWSNDPGWIPHVHITNNQNMNKATFKCALKLETPEYFIHGQHTDVLNSKQVKKLISFLNEEVLPDVTNYQFLVLTWNKNNSQATLPVTTEIPDYTILIHSII